MSVVFLLFLINVMPKEVIQACQQYQMYTNYLL